MIDLRPHVRPGDGVTWSQGCAEPTPLLHALLDQAAALGPLTAFCGISFDERLAQGPHEGLALRSYGVLGRLGALADAGGLEVARCHYSALPRLFAERRLPGDVVLVQVSPAGADGCHTLGIGVDWVADALPHARALIAEVNARMPVTAGGPRVPRTAFAAVLETDRPLLEPPAAAPGPVEHAIAGHLAGLVEDGDTLQLGVGTLPAALLVRLRDHRDLGMHTGLVTEGAVDLVEAGVLTGARKEVDRGLLVTGTVQGGRRLVDAAGRAPFALRPASHTHHPAVLARLRRLVAVNGALQVDLAGQVNAEHAGGRLRGALGGQVDFAHAASRSDGRSVIALRATTRDGDPTIVTALDGRTVTTPAGDVDFVVTEHGVAPLRGRSPAARARALVAVAAPQHRPTLSRSASKADHLRRGRPIGLGGRS